MPGELHGTPPARRPRSHLPVRLPAGYRGGVEQDRGSQRFIAFGLLILAAGLAANSLLGPLAFEVIDYHFSDSLKNQGIGLDAVSLLLIVPVSAAAAVLALRGHPAAPALALGPSFFVTYMLVQYVVGPEYLTYPGNNQRFFALHAGLFVLGAALGLVCWGRWMAIACRCPGGERPMASPGSCSVPQRSSSSACTCGGLPTQCGTCPASPPTWRPPRPSGW